MNLHKTKHLVITRFNCGYLKRVNEPEIWLKHRIELFSNFLLPSLVNQTNKNFDFVLLIEHETPILEILKIKKLCETIQCNNVFFLECESEGELCEFYKNIKKQGKVRLITTRIDNDDAVSIHFINIINEKAAGNNNKIFAINFDFGYVVNIKKTPPMFYFLKHISNSFITLVETDVDEFKGVYCFMHFEIEKKFNTIHISDKVNWLQIVHKENIANKVRGKSGKCILTDFKVNI